MSTAPLFASILRAIRLGCLCGALLLGSAPASHAGTLTVVASIQPVESIVQAVGGDAVSTRLLLDRSVSPHSFALKPSHLSTLAEADLVVWVGPGIEAFLPRALRAIDTPDLQWGKDQGESDPRHDHHDHSHAVPDPHLWLAPDTAARFAYRVADALAALAPQHADQFRANAARFSAALAELDATLTGQLETAAQPVAVVHNAFSHFAVHYGLPDPIALTDLAEETPSARDARTAQRDLSALTGGCVLVEPTTNLRWIRLLSSQADQTLRRVDPIGRDLDRGPDLYFKLLHNIADAFSTCSLSVR